MRIRRLELVGFKSFVEPTVIEFDSPIVGIVGPNGCGKSNVVDAIRWVMGEMSAKSLRGRAMEDVIFNGTEGHPPLGMAEVTLTFSTEDGIVPPEYAGFSEIAIARRLYRSGESEYFINKVPARHRDIIDLLLGTGVGHRAYSLIEQGRIEWAINAKPEERRLMIEEAAGVSKFKARKEAALRKMEATDQNLARLKDILGEVTRQINSLDRQVKKAERYRALQEELKERELRRAAVTSHELQRQISELTSLLNDWTLRETTSAARLATLEAEREKDRLDLAEQEQEVHSLQERYFEVASRLKLLEAQEGFNQQEIRRLEGLQQETVRRLEEIKGKRQSLEEKRNLLQEGLKSHQALKAEEGGLRETIANEQERKESLFQELNLRREEGVLKRSRLKSLLDLERNLEGYEEGVRAVLKAKREQGLSEAGGILGVVAEVIETPPQYEVAVSAALGEKLQYIIVRSHEEGIEAINLLKAQSSGRSSFIPLEVREGASRPFPSGEQGVIGPLLDRVQLKEEYQRIGQSLLGDVILVETLGDALALWRSNGHQKTLVTLEGEVVDPSGVVSGGITGLRGKILLEKKREIRELKTWLPEIEEEIGLKEDTLSQLEGSLSDHLLDLKQITRQVEEEERKRIGLETEIHHLEEGSRQAEKEFALLTETDQKRSQLTQSLEQSASERETLRKTTGDLAAAQAETRTRHTTLATSLQEKESALREVRKENDLARSHTGDLRVTLSRLETDLHHLGQQIEEKYRQPLSEIALPSTPVDPSEEEAQMTELKEKIHRLGEVNLASISESGELRRRQEFLSTQVTDLEEAQAALRRAIHRIHQTTRRRFEETFEKVNEKFRTLFPRLFEGGHAELRLTDDDLLQAGVELLIQPPGKKLSHIGLLSGGEKAMAAVAFVFSIFLIKPSPFCILDEVDAPLDDVNITRFHRLLTEMVPRTQFILITHNRRTMEKTDLLYGVTMQEPGVSKVVSVRLSEEMKLAS